MLLSLGREGKGRGEERGSESEERLKKGFLFVCFYRDNGEEERDQVEVG